MLLPAESPKPRVLVIEDESTIRELLLYNLVAGGFDTYAADAGEPGLLLWQRHAPHVVLLDLMLPDISGTEVCRRIRAGANRPQPAVIMLTARAEEVDRVVGFEVGADDYVVKPFSMRELLLRVRACLRKAGVPEPGGPVAAPAQPPAQNLRRGGIEVDIDRYQVFAGGELVRLTALEIRLLVYLMEAGGKVRSREQLLQDVWGYAPTVSSRTVDTHVKRLRDALGPMGDVIETVRGVGYRFADAPTRPTAAG